MNTDELEKCLHLLGYGKIHYNKSVIKQLANKSDIHINYIVPFSKELNDNLLSLKTTQGKTDLIKHWIFRMWRLHTLYQENNILFDVFSYLDDGWLKLLKDGGRLFPNESEGYILDSSIAYNLMFVVIQKCCFKYNISFSQICSELNFPTTYLRADI
jgi:hypothetical protein